MTQMNQTLFDQCSVNRCQRALDKSVGLAQQAVAVSFVNANNPFYAAYEHVSWLRWNNLSVTFMGSPALAQKLRSRAVSLSLMGRNLGLWSNYRGADPEVNTASAGNHTRDSGGVPQTRDWSIRVNLNF
jgi:hypothetical protein